MATRLILGILPVAFALAVGNPATGGTRETVSAPCLSLRSDLQPSERLTANLANTNLDSALRMYAELTGRKMLPATNKLSQRVDELFGGRLSRWRILRPSPAADSGITFHRDGFYSALDVKRHLEQLFKTNGLVIVPDGKRAFRVVPLIAMGVKNGDQALAARKFQDGLQRQRLIRTALAALLIILTTSGLLLLKKRSTSRSRGCSR